MEADWEIEIGGDASVIESHWAGFVDLRRMPKAAYHLPECEELSALREVLVQLNSVASPIWTTKCDIWTVDTFDPYELDASTESTHAFGCYIDLLPDADKSVLQWTTPAATTDWCKSFCARLHAVPLNSWYCADAVGLTAGGRVDLVIRRAVLADQKESFAITAYFTGCGQREIGAKQGLEAVLRAFAHTLCSIGSDSTLK